MTCVLFSPLAPDVKLPQYQTAGAIAADLHIHTINGTRKPAEKFIMRQGMAITVGTGLRVSVPEGLGMFVFGRSGLGCNYKVRLANCVGLIDCDYRGEVLLEVVCDQDTRESVELKIGDRIAQAVFMPVVKPIFRFVDTLDSTLRNAGGFGSTGL